MWVWQQVPLGLSPPPANPHSEIGSRHIPNRIPYATWHMSYGVSPMSHYHQNRIPLNRMAGHLGEGQCQGHCRERCGYGWGGCGAVCQRTLCSALGATTRRRRPVALDVAGRRSRLQPTAQESANGKEMCGCRRTKPGACLPGGPHDLTPSWEWEGKLIGRCLVAVTISV